ncbi:hypothetical protein C2845_PM05G30190 [Panicum miliaceum]|uniref:Uncharacterized protein n=1 Tax=Panicum miliaceum TaxID=4540 RepID=A0A3L6T2S2_PANMI|nr:hypothetical protein C2845_PM05G30190 [Panicum miliaceum]
MSQLLPSLGAVIAVHVSGDLITVVGQIRAAVWLLWTAAMMWYGVKYGPPRPSSDCLSLPNGIAGGSSVSGSRKPPAAPAPRSSKDDAAPAVATDSSRLAAFLASTSLEPKQRARAPQPPAPAPAAPSSSPAAVATRSPARDHGHHQHYSDFSDPASPSAAGVGGSGEVLLQWGQNKRSRGRRDAASGSGASPQRRAGAKIQRRSPAPVPPSGPSYTRGSNLRAASPLPPRSGAGIGTSDAHHSRGALPHHHRYGRRLPSPSRRLPVLFFRSRFSSSAFTPATEPYSRVRAGRLRGGLVALGLRVRAGRLLQAWLARSSGSIAPVRVGFVLSGSAAEERAVGKSSSASAAAGKQRLASDKAPQQAHKAGPGPVMGLGVPDPKPQHHHQGGQQHPGGGAGASSSSSKPAPKLELPRIYTTLSRKEKEEDFLAMKGTKLPQRPKRRPKNVEKAFVCPGAWLTDVTRSRYEVREKKCPKKGKYGCRFEFLCRRSVSKFGNNDVVVVAADAKPWIPDAVVPLQQLHAPAGPWHLWLVGNTLGSGNGTGSAICYQTSLDARPASLWRPWFPEEICGLQLLERWNTRFIRASDFCLGQVVSVFGPVKSHRRVGGSIGQKLCNDGTRNLVRP